MNNFDIVIVGAGPSGIYSATYAALKGMNVLVVESSDILGGQPRQLYGHKKVYDFPGHLVTTGEIIVENLLNQQKSIKNQIKYLLNTNVIKYKHLKNNLISLKLSNKKTIKTKAIIISTGNGTLVPNLINPELIKEKVNQKNIHYYVEHFDNYKNLNLVVLGGGDSAVEWASQLAESQKPKNVSIIHRKPMYRANAKYVNELKINKVNEYLDFEIESIDKKFIYIKSNTNKKISKINYDKIIVQYGLKQIKPKVDPFIKINRLGIKYLVDKNQQTNEPNIYAIGASTYYKGRPNLMIVGISEGVIAIKHIYDKINPYNQDYITKD
ncbi:NAD(P)/FAD-dependent oxidoreductase [Mycoplasmoides pirum]|uniref:NAD(P)/FAD-dependent oxidoreductase n=1 Tax=Mycoplasmoides pirum TaxID=2122 RepID=UPI00047F16E9|nr:NAD(P)/FAD-dependent oxidoreductase [Mycoplasmoides pirum]